MIPLSIDSYVTYRVHPTLNYLLRKSTKLAWRLNALDILTFIVQTTGAILGAFKRTEG